MLNPLLIGGISREVPPSPSLHRRLVRSVYTCTSRCTGARTLYTLFCLREIPADSYSPERNKRYLFPSSPFPSRRLSFSFSWSLAEENRACGSGEVPATWPTTPLRSLRSSRTSYRGFSFYASHFLLFANFVFLSCPSLAPPSTVPLAVLPQLLSFFSPFLVAPPRDPVTGDYATHNGEI